MNTLVFSIVWTVGSGVLIVLFFRQEGFDSHPVWFNTVMALMPVAGVPFIWDSLRKLRRYRSVREEDGAFIWTDLDGSERRDTVDPRIVWQADDRKFSDN